MGKVPTELSWKSVAEYLSWRPDQVSSCNLPHFTTLLEGIYDSRQCRCVELQRNSVPTAQSLWSRQKPLVVQQHAPTTPPIVYNSTLIASTPTAILHSSSAATRSCSSRRSSHALLSH